jgi:hypothetical protein
MDVIILSVNPADIHSSWMPNIVDIFINGKNLIDIVREVELPSAIEEGSSEIAGHYMGLQPSELLNPFTYQNGKIAIFDCASFCATGCWPLLVKVTVTDNLVIWEEFEQYHRGPTFPGKQWRYDGLRFVFDRKQYNQEFSKLANYPDTYYDSYYDSYEE